MKRTICCNECHRLLSVGELAYYPLQWQYSGDMYCHKHETRTQFKQPVRVSEAVKRTERFSDDNTESEIQAYPD